MNTHSLLAALLLASHKDESGDIPEELNALKAALGEALRDALVGPLSDAIRFGKLPPFLTTIQLCELTSWSARKVAYLRSERRIPFIRRGRSVLFRTRDVIAYMDEALVNAKVPLEVPSGGSCYALGG